MAPSLVADSPSVENDQEASNDGNINLDNTFITSDSDFTNLGGVYLEWDNPNIDFTDVLNPHTINETVQYPSLEPSPLVHNSTFSTDPTVQVQRANSSPNGSIPRQPANILCSMIQRPKMNTGAQRVANLIFHTLRSYPLMLHHNTLPPFIHPRLISSEFDKKDMEPLTNCITLVHMISSGVQGSRTLFRKNVRLECERLYGEVR